MITRERQCFTYVPWFLVKIPKKTLKFVQKFSYIAEN